MYISMYKYIYIHTLFGCIHFLFEKILVTDWFF